jgi:hypothetical protein
MKIKFNILLCSVVFLIVFTATLSAQAKLNAFPIQASTLIADLIQKKTDNPKITAKELASLGNEIIANAGVNYHFELSESNCKALFEVKKKLKPDQKMSALQGKLNQPEGNPVDIIFPDVNFTDNCGCYINIPSLNVVEADFVTKIRGVNIKFIRSSNFKNTVDLVDNAALTKQIRRWYIPFPTIPIGVYEDGTILFLDFPDSEFKELALAIYESGTIQIVSKSDWDLKEKPTQLKDFPRDASNSKLNFISFGNGEKKRVLKFNSPCK